MKAKVWASLGLAAFLLLGLWLLLGGSPFPAARAAGGETFTVNSTGDAPDASEGNCICATAAGVCTLRAALQEANACPGPQTIRFSGPFGIQPSSPLPSLTDNGTVIDGSEWWAVGSGHGGMPAVEVNGASASSHGLEIRASNCAVYGLVIQGFSGHGIYLHGGARNNRIGGPGHRRVVVSANGQNGVRIEGSATTDNVVENVYIGTDPEGLAGASGSVNWANAWHGVSVWQGGGNVISDCLIAHNAWSGVAVDHAAKDVIQSNRIGVNILGEPLGNGFYGVHVAHEAQPVIVGNTIAFNRRGVHVEGGGAPWIIGNTIAGHNASHPQLTQRGYGGGILCFDPSPEQGTAVSVVGNWIGDNVAYTGTGQTGYGGGIALWYCDGSQIEGNTIVRNTASGASVGRGGGIYIIGGGVTLAHNAILSNIASVSSDGYGGGIALDQSAARVIGNRVQGNAAVSGAGGFGGGLYLSYSDAALDANQVLGNRALFGAGIEVANSARFTLTNHVIAQNAGQGVRVWASSSPVQGVLAHNTIASHTAPALGIGLYAWQNAVLALTNTILAGNATGIQAKSSASNSVFADYTLYYANGDDREGSVIVSTHEITGLDPRFRAPAAGDYHLRAGSPAIDAGRAVPWLTTDLDGDTRPVGGYDLGADEYLARLYLPLVLRNYP